MKHLFFLLLFVSSASAQVYPNFPIVGQPAYSCGQVNSVSDCTVPAGPPALTGNETILLDTNLPNSEQPSTALVTVDTLKTFISGSGSGIALNYTLINGSGGTALAGSPVYISGSGTYNLAKADTYSTAGVIGLVTISTASTASGPVTLSGIITLTTSRWDIIAGTSGGLTPGSIYFLDPSTVGKLTSVVPTTAGQLITYVGRAVSPTVMLLSIQPPIQL